ncbi:peptide chain release factor 1 [Burkholderia multivorans]|nr:peptide chain release factor 1 [Burkholderia multivorans]PRE87097.1 peptide chain release factor 1 [Burkholderia multivorans]PRF35595.1 peptide chain release factor 1 [Burkholderia multivorans]PRG04361.1 peptide chain release factor 1 [Burkholderia multivorans]PRG26527.1 peptide chain release factor 1 [Burkholderia multivorans]
MRAGNGIKRHGETAKRNRKRPLYRWRASPTVWPDGRVPRQSTPRRSGAHRARRAMAVTSR